MGQDKQVKKDSPLYEQNTLILAASQNGNLVKIEKDKSLALINAWEESEKAKAQTKANRELCSIEIWENNMKTALELDLKKMEEKLELEKAEYTKRFKKKFLLSECRTEDATGLTQIVNQSGSASGRMDGLVAELSGA
ncbi:unnamed protein product [Microthlaspi erraticum]|uniref:Remorin C-terminal domain-containing protein n=1 Tax=Microthlaspi erraticum TaxID=1685480 RepID=A0A6D2JH19_9BRAS|nr:unnamed protein product [Microthlaspi erraticum]